MIDRWMDKWMISAVCHVCVSVTSCKGTHSTHHHQHQHQHQKVSPPASNRRPSTPQQSQPLRLILTNQRKRNEPSYTNHPARLNRIRHIIKVHRRQPARRRRRRQDEIDRPEAGKGAREREERVVRVLDEDQVGAHHRARERGPDRLHGAARGGVGRPDDGAGAHDGRAANVQRCQVEVCDAVSVTVCAVSCVRME